MGRRRARARVRPDRPAPLGVGIVGVHGSRKIWRACRRLLRFVSLRWFYAIIIFMSTVRASTARFLAKQKNHHTRARYKQDILLWKTFCAEHNLHALDGSFFAAQLFSEWLESRYTSSSVHSRFSGVRRWFDQLLRDGVIKNHGFRNVVLPKRDRRVNELVIPTEDEVAAMVLEASKAGPRWEWLVSMIAYGGAECAEAQRVRSTDVRSWEGRTLIRLRSRAGYTREVPVDGRLEVLTLGLAGVFAPTTPLGPTVQLRYVRTRLTQFSTAGCGRVLNILHLRRFAVKRQADRGVPVAVIARWLGHRRDDEVRHTLQMATPMDAVTTDDIVKLIQVEPDGGRFGTGRAADSRLPAGS